MVLPFVLAHPADDFGCGRYRVRYPADALAAADVAEVLVSPNFFALTQVRDLSPDVIVCQRVLEYDQLRYLERLRQRSEAFLIMDMDDLITRPQNSNKLESRFPKDTAQRLRSAISLVDRLVVSTPYLAQEYGFWASECVVARNGLPRSLWTFPRRPLRDRRPRVGWAGSSGHLGDLKILYPVVRALSDRVDWVFMGDIPGAISRHCREVHPRVPIDVYPQALYDLDLDLAVAPLEDCPFNSAKSHLRLLELGACGYPVICSDVPAFDVQLFGVTRVRNTAEEWISALEVALGDREGLGVASQQIVDSIHQSWFIDCRVGEWASAWAVGSDALSSFDLAPSPLLA